jgi:hypothetical protein
MVSPLPGYLLSQLLFETRGTVLWRGLHEHTGLPVTLERIPKSLFTGQSDFVSAVSSIRDLWHPFIAELFDVVECDSDFWLISEESFRSFRDYLSEKRVLPEGTYRKYFAQLISALTYLHERGVPHGSLSLRHILLDRNNNLKLVDLGLSAQFGLHGEDQREIAPEVVAGGKPTLASDIWSAGLFLLTMATGSSQFEDGFPATLPKALQDLIGKMLATDPAERIGIGEIPDHPWMKATQYWVFLSNRVRDQLSNASMFDRLIARRMIAMGIECDDLQRQVAAGERTPLTVMYRQVLRDGMTEALKDLVDQPSPTQVGNANIRRMATKTLPHAATQKDQTPPMREGPRILGTPMKAVPGRRISAELKLQDGPQRMLGKPAPLGIASRRISRS